MITNGYSQALTEDECERRVQDQYGVSRCHLLYLLK